ncbi:MAG: TRAP transporter substrate-binding protein [Spirochaetaceae bacterium]|nr:MAG: TRAP transporter substrate-binding protein [Spirochaetaceae bacterium]
MAKNFRTGMRTALVVLMVLVSVGAFAGGQRASATREIKLANFYAPTHPVNIALNEVFVPMIEEGSNGRFTVQVFDSSSLGAERELTEGVQLGTIEMGVAGGLLSATYPRIGALELPFLFSDFDHVWRVFDGEIGEQVAEDFEDAGLKVLAWIGNGFRVFSNSVRPINGVADTRGIKMRMPENDVYIATARALGFEVVAMGFGEVYNAMATGVIDGQDNPLATLYASRFYEVQDYVAISNHMFSHGSIVMNLDLWNSLSAADQELFRNASRETAILQRRLLAEGSDEFIRLIEAEGLTVTFPDIAEFRAATESVRANFARNYDWAPRFIETILSLDR